MPHENTAVFGIYGTRQGIENAVNALKVDGYRNSDISVLFPCDEGIDDVAGNNSKRPDGAFAGAGSGAIIGGVMGWLIGVGTLAIPGVGPFIAAGPVVAALTVAGVGGALGGIAGGLIGLGIPEYEARHYEGRIHKGGILLSVNCDCADWVRKVKELLVRTGADDVSSTGEPFTGRQLQLCRI